QPPRPREPGDRCALHHRSPGNLRRPHDAIRAMSGSDSLAIHGTAIAIGNAALLLTGPSGSGKSDLALRMIDGGARLVADDRVELVVEGDRLCCRAPSD